ncbi:hypothetical protein BU26DRAFT_568048 [Trematosphaeria pertusa]|uniref:Uncharacterized protein n=1 Tax=Trematosphaeria pertusa TaxID=390896 RepID=A0A6A6I4L3_9PLEO|nr:uncharacterized protein BU26DRAFT_568048 [Trematosphaeria pertusa]KAF2245464.1 hypothetical protein BU26DRAFT_568048 [Trematosphaeria pertusa]
MDSTNSSGNAINQRPSPYQAKPIPQPRQHDHLVYVGRTHEGQTNLYINVGEDLKRPFFCNSFYPNHVTGVVRYQIGATPPPHKVEDLGWFSDPTAFTPICTGQPVQPAPPNQPNQAETFNAWKLALLRDLAQNYGHLWTRNDVWLVFGSATPTDNEAIGDTREWKEDWIQDLLDLEKR